MILSHTWLLSFRSIIFVKYNVLFIIIYLIY